MPPLCIHRMRPCPQEQRFAKSNYTWLVPRIGTCGLCLREGQQLQQSHLLPAAVYRLMRNQERKNTDPVRIDSDRVVQNSKQVRDFFLCKCCERRFDENGERWILDHHHRGAGQFLLQSILKRSEPLLRMPGETIYQALNIPEIDVKAITYFAVTMFWRAGSHTWQTGGGKATKNQLGIS
jgi:hypothetical protein